MSRSTHSSRPRGRALLVLPLAVLAFACSPTGEPGDALVPDLPNTIARHEEGSPFVAFNIWVKAGSQSDPSGKEGIAALTASLLSNGASQQDTYQDILAKLYPMATGWGSVTDKEMTTFRGVVHRDHLEGFYELLKNSLLSPGFLAEDFDRVKSQQLNFLERGRRFQRDEELSKELLFSKVYAGTPYEHPEEGYVQSVKSITLEDVQSFYSSHYTRDNVVVGVGGGFGEGFVARVRQDFDALPEGAVATVPAPQPAALDRVKVLIVEKETAATAISIGFPIDVTRGEADFWELMLTNAWFGEHRSSFSNLYQVIRERRGMNYGDYSYIEAFPLGFTTQERPINVSRRSQLFEIWIRPISGTGPGTLHDRSLFATKAALRELDQLTENGLPADQVERTQQYLRNFSVTYGSTALRRLSFAIDDAFYGFDSPGYLASVRDGIAGTSTESVKAAIQKHLGSEGYWLILITKDAEAMKGKLLSGESTGISYPAQQPPELLAEDEQIADFPIAVAEEDIEIIDISEVFEG